MGKDVAPRYAARNDVSAMADVMELRVEGDRLVAWRPVYSGKARVEVDCGAAKLQIATTRPNVFAAEADVAAGEPAVEALELGDVAISSRPSARRWALRARSSMPDGSTTSTRWGRPARSCRPRSTLPAAFPAPSSTWPEWGRPR